MKTKNYLSVILLFGLGVPQVGCLTAAVGAAIRHTKVTAPSFESYSFSREIEQVFQQSSQSLLEIGTIEKTDKTSGEIIGTDKEKMYKYSMNLKPGDTPTTTTVSIRVELIGNWETVNWIKTSDKSQSIINSIASKLGVTPTLTSHI